MEALVIGGMVWRATWRAWNRMMATAAASDRATTP
jgi:hypothetical protein